MPLRLQKLPISKCGKRSRNLWRGFHKTILVSDYGEKTAKSFTSKDLGKEIIIAMTNRITFHRLWLENLIYLALGLLVLGIGVFKFGESLLENVVSLVLGFVILSPLLLYPQHIEIDDHKLIVSYLLRERIFTRREIASIVLNTKVYRGGSYFALYIIPKDQKLISIANFNQSNPIIYEVLIKWHNTK